MYINFRTEFSFRSVYGPIGNIIAFCKSHKSPFAGIADLNNTFGHIKWEKACQQAEIKPIFGIRLAVSPEPKGERGYPYNIMTFVAKNYHGLQEIYDLVDIAHKQFYYRPRLSYDQLKNVTNNVYVLTGIAPQNIPFDHKKFFTEISPNIPQALLNSEIDITSPVACIDNYYLHKNQKAIYEPLVDERLLERKTTPQYILPYGTWSKYFPKKIGKEALKNLKVIADSCNVKLKIAPMISFPGRKHELMDYCIKGAKEKRINLHEDIYKKRLKRELKLIQEKNYSDYFLMVADLIRYSKKRMVVGPGRGSSGGSLVCYLMGITNIDPIKYNLFFERFIDINRKDLPDIDIDFADDKRHLAIKYLSKKYGKECVAQIGNVSRLKPRSAIAKFSKNLLIPEYETRELKEAIITRPPGDKRANLCIKDTFSDTKIGKIFVKKYPAMKNCSYIENHASHSSVHAAGVIVCNDPITKYCGINSREKQIAMIDMKDAESINLLKIDVLGLRTLSILAEVCDQIKKPYSWLDDIPLNDMISYRIFKKGRFTGIFQFEGDTMQKISADCPIESIEDIACLVSIARPGPMESGGANSYIKTRRGERKPQYLSPHESFVKATKSTLGVLVYQEQVLQILREYGLFTWEDTGILRKALSKSQGQEFFKPYQKKFIKGAAKNGRSEKEALTVWNHIKTFGGYGFNKSHAVAYAMISYQCAYCKSHYPLQFASASLNHAKDDLSARKLLKDMVENDKIKYVPFNKDISQIKWSYYLGKLYGGLLTLKGIGPVSAQKVLSVRQGKAETLPTNVKTALKKCNTYFKSIYPAKEIYGKYYKKPKKYLEGSNREIVEIKTIKKKGSYCFIGELTKKSLRDQNEPGKVERRKGRFVKAPTLYLNLQITDDSGSMNCTIDRFTYQEIGREITEIGKENEDWYLINGNYEENYERVYIEDFVRITKE